MHDEQAVARLKRGDLAALDGLVERHQQQAFRAAYLVTYDAALAEDAVQEAFLRAYRAIAQFDPKRPFAPWFMRIVVNQALKSAQRGRRTIALDDEAASSDLNLDGLLGAAPPDPHTEAERAELRQAVRAALQALPPERRAAVVLRYYLGYSEAEMAHDLGSAPGTIKSRLSRARAQLRGLLARFADEG